MKIRRIVYSFLLLLISLPFGTVLSGCTKARDTQSGAAEKAPETTADTRAGSQLNPALPGFGRRTVPLEPVEPETSPETADALPERNKPIPLGTLSQLIQMNLDAVRTPSDPVIGPLLSRLEDNADSHTVYILADTFLSGLITGKILEDKIIETERLDISRSLTYILSSEISVSEYRIGEYHPTDDREGYVKVRFISGPVSSEGEIYVEELDSGWFISDLQLDLSPFSD